MKLRINQLGAVSLRLRQNASDITSTFDIEAETPTIEPPLLANDVATVPVDGTLVVDVKANDPRPGTITAVSVLSGGGSVVITTDQKVRYTANSTAGTAVVSVTQETGDGGATTGGTEVSSLTITKQAVNQPGSGSVTIQAATTINPNEWTTTAPQIHAPAGHAFRAVATGFGVDDHWSDVRYRWTFEPAPLISKRHDTTDMPWDRVYNVDGSIFIVRGEVVYLEDGVTPHATPAVIQSQQGYRPGHGSSRTFLGYDLNTAYGPRAVHAFKDPGNYVVRCEVQKRGEAPVVATMNVTVPNTSWDATYVVSDNGNFTGEPAGAIRHSTYAAALSAANTGSAGARKRILLKRGQSHGGTTNRPSTDYTAFALDAFGEGIDPVYNGPFSFRHTTGHYSIANIDVSPSGYSSADPWNTTPSGSIEKTKTTGWLTLYNVEINGARHGFFLSKTAHGLISVDTFVTNWHGYGMFMSPQSGTFGFKGSWIKQNPNAVTGSGEDEGVPPFYVDHGPNRSAGPGGIVVYSMCDWNVIGDRVAPTSYFQPVLRQGRSPSFFGPLIEEVVIDRMRGEHGSLYGTGNSGGSAYPRRYLWDKCYLVKQDKDDIAYNPDVMGLHYRNTVCIIAATSGNGCEKWMARSNVGSTVDRPEMADFGVDLYNSTLVVMRGSGGMSWDLSYLTNGGGNALPADHVKIGNNVIYAPNMADSTETGDTPLETTEVWRSTFPGVRFQSTNIISGYTIPVGTAAFYRPLAGSGAIGSASTSHSNVSNGQGSRIAVDDFFGNVRAATTSRGAYRGPGE